MFKVAIPPSNGDRWLILLLAAKEAGGYFHDGRSKQEITQSEIDEVTCRPNGRYDFGHHWSFGFDDDEAGVLFKMTYL